MTFFFLYHPTSVAWLPAPSGAIKKKRHKKVDKYLEREKKRRKKRKEEEELLILLALQGEDYVE